MSKIERVITCLSQHVRTFLLCAFFSISFVVNANAQEFDLLLKGGHVIDPKNNIDTKMDVAITNGKISKVAVNIPSTSSKKSVDVSGLYVSPGIKIGRASCRERV